MVQGHLGSHLTWRVGKKGSDVTTGAWEPVTPEVRDLPPDFPVKPKIKKQANTPSPLRLVKPFSVRFWSWVDRHQ